MATLAFAGIVGFSTAQAQVWGKYDGVDGDGNDVFLTPASQSYSFLAFRSSGGTGASTDLIFQLGNLNTLLAGGGSFTIDQSGASSILSTTYGSDWATAGNVSWAVVGSDDNLKFTLSSVSAPSALNGAKFNTINGNISNFDGWAAGADLSGVTTSFGLITVASGSDTVLGSFTGIDDGRFGGSFAASLSSLGSSLGLYTFSYPGSTAANATAARLGTLALTSGTFTFTGTAVPEPSSYALIGLAALGFVIAIRNKKNRKVSIQN